ncbi:tetraacyldisaccharide 4'-kinase [Zunongwangia sp. F363]|uniref:Tetraacyldisaccharide 4'-kinase n=1 Tax=Autumnicola tepida TaxID=3075595 RepID=A0ABU3C7X9_9FLAO|nr:tetraacyldisaccharide 4'-kinase [Zunongwangia sp. F363]MDT0642443.1 tetraacyldisaccharide 4'-kinase [Zunongwangia sp. F363]
MVILRKLLFPFSLLYGGITWMRNFLYNSGIFKSREYETPVICVGNLNTGGTGKSPMIEFLLKMLLPQYKVATLSRGYKRKSKGYAVLSGKESAEEVGDEPLQFKTKYEKAIVAVDADRRNGISCLAEENPEVILLDDAFQHRKVKAGFNILLTAYHDLYVDDVMLPSGNLREPSAGAERAEVIVVTKCPPGLKVAEMEQIRNKIKPRNYQKLFFSYISYAEEIFGKAISKPVSDLQKVEFTLVTGIANPVPLLTFLKEKKLNFQHLKFPDHHNFSSAEIEEISAKKLILTTEKDYMRLKSRIPAGKLWYLPITTKFIAKENGFKSEVEKFIKTNI